MQWKIRTDILLEHVNALKQKSGEKSDRVSSYQWGGMSAGYPVVVQMHWAQPTFLQGWNFAIVMPDGEGNLQPQRAVQFQLSARAMEHSHTQLFGPNEEYELLPLLEEGYAEAVHENFSCAIGGGETLLEFTLQRTGGYK